VQGLGLFSYFGRGLRVSRLLDLRGVYGPKNCERMITKWAGKSKGFKGIMEEEEWELKILDSGYWMLVAEFWILVA